MKNENPGNGANGGLLPTLEKLLLKAGRATVPAGVRKSWPYRPVGTVADPTTNQLNRICCFLTCARCLHDTLHNQRFGNQLHDAFDLDAQFVFFADIPDLGHAVKTVGGHDFGAGLTDLLGFFLAHGHPYFA